jgi:hypothetical protein
MKESEELVDKKVLIRKVKIKHCIESLSETILHLSERVEELRVEEEIHQQFHAKCQELFDPELVNKANMEIRNRIEEQREKQINWGQYVEFDDLDGLPSYVAAIMEVQNTTLERHTGCI